MHRAGAPRCPLGAVVSIALLQPQADSGLWFFPVPPLCSHAQFDLTYKIPAECEQAPLFNRCFHWAMHLFGLDINAIGLKCKGPHLPTPLTEAQNGGAGWTQPSGAAVVARRILNTQSMSVTKSTVLYNPE